MHPWPFHRFIQGTCAHLRPFDVREVCRSGQWPPPLSAERLTVHGHTRPLTSLGNGGNMTSRQTRVCPGPKTMGHDNAYLYPFFLQGPPMRRGLSSHAVSPNVCCAEARPRRDRIDLGHPTRQLGYLMIQRQLHFDASRPIVTTTHASVQGLYDATIFCRPRIPPPTVDSGGIAQLASEAKHRHKM